MLTHVIPKIIKAALMRRELIFCVKIILPDRRNSDTGSPILPQHLLLILDDFAVKFSSSLIQNNEDFLQRLQRRLKGPD